jgi:hypothetical protein
MKKRTGRKADDLREEYDFSTMTGVRNKYAGKLSGRVVWISLDPDVAKAFPTGAVVNRVLRAAMKAATTTARQKVRRARSLDDGCSRRCSSAWSDGWSASRLATRLLTRPATVEAFDSPRHRRALNCPIPRLQ